MDFAGIRPGEIYQSILPRLLAAGLGHHRRSGFSGYTPQEWQLNSNESWRLTHLLTLGINYSQMHDSSACIVRNGELLFAVAEERLSRIKHDAGFPRLAIQACLDFADVPASQLDQVCFGWPRPGAAYRHDLRCFATGKMPANYLNVLNSTLHFLSMWHQQGGAKRFTQHFGKVKARMRFVDLIWPTPSARMRIPVLPIQRWW